jgi:N-acetylglucosamine-6-sulfatase
MHWPLTWLACSLLLLVAAPPVAAAPAARPSIVLVFADDMMLEDMIAVPRTRALVGGKGATFDNAFVGVSLCCPSRATILTGRYPQNTGVYTNNGTNGGYQTFKENGGEASTIGTWLRQAGYRTAYIGKYLNGYPARNKYLVPPGWDRWVSPTHNFEQQFDYYLNVNGEIQFFGRDPNDYATDVLGRKAIDFIEQVSKRDKPFLLVLSPFAPHDPAVSAPRHATLYRDARLPRTPAHLERDVRDKPWFYRLPPLSPAQWKTIVHGYRQRLRSLAAVDEMVEAIIDKLRSLSRLDSTYVVFTSDNGFKLGHHRLGVSKMTEFDSDMRVPLLIRGPGIRAGTRIGSLVTNADLAPTFAAWADALPSRAPDGRSLVPLLAGKEPKDWRKAFPIAHGRKEGWRLGTWKDQGLFKGVPYVLAPAYRGLRSKRYLFTRYSGGARQLYDLKDDPFELHNLAGQAPNGVEAALMARAKALSTCAAAECRRLESLPLPGS